MSDETATTDESDTERVAIVTGGSSGIGRRIATRLAQEDYAIVVGDLQSEPRTGVHADAALSTPTTTVIREELGGESMFVQVDVAEPDEVRDLVDRTVAEFGRLDVLVNNAGVFVPGGLADTTIEDWNRVLAVNLSGVFYCSKFAAPHLVETSGTIVNVGSHESAYGGTGPAYSSSKARVANLTRDMAIELGPEGVRVNAVEPGLIQSPMVDYAPAQVEKRAESTPIRRIGRPEDVAAVVAFLIDEAAEFVHGEQIVVDGGETARFHSTRGYPLE